MKAFEDITAVAVPLMRNNIDTDAIIPSREIKGLSKAGLGEALFAGWRYGEPGSRKPRPDFVLNRPEYAGAQVLLGGENFGCGSSREHAVWALQEWGIRAVIAPSFGAIFYANCIQNGLLPVVLDRVAVAHLAELSERDPRVNLVSISLAKQTVTAAGGEEFGFPLSATHKEMLLTGQDQIDLTFELRAQILEFQKKDRRIRPWAYLQAHLQA